jgi:hypothetical protein
MIFVNPEAGVNYDIPNIGLAYAATYFGVEVIDQNSMPNPPDRFLRYGTDILGISVQSRTFSESMRIAGQYRAKYPDARVKSISGFLDVQCCYPVLNFDDRIVFNEPFSDRYPFPDYEVFDSFELFRRNWRMGTWGYAIMTSHGCPYRCTFCSSRNRKWRARSPENCYEELKIAVKKWDIKSVVILDDCFNVDKARVIRFSELMRKLGLMWGCSNGLRADAFDDEMAEAMSSSGCVHINFGIESSDPTVLERVEKGETIESIEKAVRVAKRYFKSVGGFFIIGLPGSSYEKDLSSLEWAGRNQINAHFSYYVPFDRAMQYDALFYGKGSRPLSDVYPKELQIKVYDMTACLREQGGWFKKNWTRSKLFLRLNSRNRLGYKSYRPERPSIPG